MEFVTTENYYSKKWIAFQLVQAVRHREVAFVDFGGSRGARIDYVEYFWDYLRWCNWYKKKQRLYRSVAKYSFIPNFTLNAQIRSSYTLEWFQSEDYKKSIYEYDLFIDFDKEEDEKDLSSVYSDAKKLYEIYSDFGLPFYIVFSGSKGFQFIIDGAYLPRPVFKDNFLYPHKEIAERIKSMFGLSHLDLSNNGVPNRLCKIPYSVVGENVALPLDDSQFNSFDIENMKLNKIIQNVTLFNRGLIERQGNKSNVDNFIKELGVV
jgi:hypothetical protein